MCGVLRSFSSQLFERSKTLSAPRSKPWKFVNKILDVFKEKEHQVKRSRIDRPAAWGGVAYSHNKVVHAFFVSWKIAQEKAPRTAGENLIKPAAVKTAWILCGDAVTNGYGSFVKQHHQLAYSRTIRRCSATNYCFCKAQWKIYFTIG